MSRVVTESQRHNARGNIGLRHLKLSGDSDSTRGRAWWTTFSREALSCSGAAAISSRTTSEMYSSSSRLVAIFTNISVFSVRPGGSRSKKAPKTEVSTYSRIYSRFYAIWLRRARAVSRRCLRLFPYTRIPHIAKYEQRAPLTVPARTRSRPSAGGRCARGRLW